MYKKAKFNCPMCFLYKPRIKSTRPHTGICFVGHAGRVYIAKGKFICEDCSNAFTLGYCTLNNTGTMALVDFNGGLAWVRTY